jgi:hypothetical protein
VGFPYEDESPIFSEHEALEVFRKSPAGRMSQQEGARATARFGLFNGVRRNLGLGDPPLERIPGR